MTEHPDDYLDTVKAERAALEVALGERARMIERMKTAESAREEPRYHDYTKDAAPVVTRSAPTHRRDTQAMTNMSAEWKSYIEARAKSWVVAVTAATGEVLAEERKRVAEEHTKMRAEFQAALDSLKIEMLESQLAEARGLPRRSLKVVPPMDSMIG